MKNTGFTLIELMIVVAIAGVLITLGAPALSNFLADQRVRTTTSDIMAEIALTRARALETSRLVSMHRNGATWNQGWSIIVNRAPDPDEVVKKFDGFPPGTMYVCNVGASFDTDITFRPDGRVVHNAPPATPPQEDGIYVVDTMGDTVAANNKIRGIPLGGAARATVIVKNGEDRPCCADPPCP